MWRYSIPAVMIASSVILLFAGVSYGQNEACRMYILALPTMLPIYRQCAGVEIEISDIGSDYS